MQKVQIAEAEIKPRREFNQASGHPAETYGLCPFPALRQEGQDFVLPYIEIMTRMPLAG